MNKAGLLNEQSIDRAMNIIHILMSNPQQMEWSITELAERTQLPLSTMHRLLSSLIQHGLVMLPLCSDIPKKWSQL